MDILQVSKHSTRKFSEMQIILLREKQILLLGCGVWGEGKEKGVGCGEPLSLICSLIPTQVTSVHLVKMITVYREVKNKTQSYGNAPSSTPEKQLCGTFHRFRVAPRAPSSLLSSDPPTQISLSVSAAVLKALLVPCSISFWNRVLPPAF